MSEGKLGRNPFRPGPATKPAYLAGRGREMQVIADALEDISQPQDGETGRMKEGPRAPIRIVGPRGSGKTTLLTAARLKAEKNNIPVALVSRLTNLSAQSELCLRLAAIMRGEGLWAQAMEKVDKVKDFKAGSAGAGIVTDEQKGCLKSIVKGCLAKRPLLLLLDEAMEADPAALQELLAICQEMISYQHPLAFMLAGTPKLDQTLAKAKASFVDRTENLYINTLTPEATREGLKVPFEEKGAKVHEKALELMAGMTDDYPFFIQAVGHEAWNAMVMAEREEVDEEIVSQAEENIQMRRDGLHKVMYGKMRSAKLVSQALHVMEILKLNDGRATDQTIIGSLARDDSDAELDRATDVFHELIDRGFIWWKGNQLEAGIPSFFSYCAAIGEKTSSQNQNIPSK